MRDQATINEIYGWAKKNGDKYYQQYQQTGTPATLRTAQRYEDICDICHAAEIGNSDEDRTRKDILHNQLQMLASFDDMMSVSRGKTFTADEVKAWMRKMMV